MRRQTWKRKQASARQERYRHIGHMQCKGCVQWKLEYMARKILGEVLNDKREIIRQTVDLINKYAVADSKDNNSVQLEE